VCTYMPALTAAGPKSAWCQLTHSARAPVSPRRTTISAAPAFGLGPRTELSAAAARLEGQRWRVVRAPAAPRPPQQMQKMPRPRRPKSPTIERRRPLWRPRPRPHLRSSEMSPWRRKMEAHPTDTWILSMKRRPREGPIVQKWAKGWPMSTRVDLYLDDLLRWSCRTLRHDAARRRTNPRFSMAYSKVCKSFFTVTPQLFMPSSSFST